MKNCPICNKWPMEFDDYFGRFRCLNPDCGWMPPSAAEREITLRRKHSAPEDICCIPIQELGLTLKVSYDGENDALLFDFGASKPSFELPEPDGITVWKVGRESGEILGFTVFRVRELGISRVRVDIISRATRKGEIESGIKRNMDLLAHGRATRMLIDSVTVTTHTESEALSVMIMERAVGKALDSFQAFLEQNGEYHPECARA